jgi:hypothetical protein
VLDGVSVVWTILHEELLKVVRGQPCLVLAASRGSHSAHHTGAAHFLAIATIVVDRDCSLLKTLLAPLPTALGTLPDILEVNVKRRLPAVAWGRAELGRLIAGGILGDDTA